MLVIAVGAATSVAAAAGPSSAGPSSAGPSSAGESTPAALTLDAALLAPQPELYFNLAYCGSGRQQDSTSVLHALDWRAAAQRFGLTIVRRHTAGYRDFTRSLRRQSPSHTILLYLHAHALFQGDDRPGALNLLETNYLHGSDPAALRLTPVREGLLIDWAADERWKYDEFGVMSPARTLSIDGYRVWRAAPGAELERLVDLAAPGTAFIDSTAVPGVRYRYRVDSIDHQGHVLPYSSAQAGSPWAPEEWAQRSEAPVVVFDYQRDIGAAVDAATYPMRVRFQTLGSAGAARLRIDRNADRDFEDAGETVALQRTAGGWVEGVTELDAASRSAQDLHRVIGFAYIVEVEGPAGVVRLPARGSFTTSINNRLRSRRYGFYIMRPATAGWLHHQVQAIRHQIGASHEVSGLFLDELVVDLRHAADADPVEFPATGFQQESVTLVETLRARYPGLVIYYNGFGDGADPPAAAGGMLEGFCTAAWFQGGAAPGLAPPPIWAAQMQMALGGADAGRAVLLLARDRPLGDLRARLYALASFHIVRGSATRFCYLPGTCAATPLPEWQIDLGGPRESFISLTEARRGRAGQLYRRRFERGEVWVNGDRRQSRVVEPDRPCLRIALASVAGSAGGAAAVEEVGSETVALRVRPSGERFELGPQSGAILIYR